MLPRFGTTQLVKISNGAVRVWVAEMLDTGLSPATVRKAVFALRQCLAAAMADNRLSLNPADDVPLPSERMKPPRFLSQFGGGSAGGADARAVPRHGAGGCVRRSSLG